MWPPSQLCGPPPLQRPLEDPQSRRFYFHEKDIKYPPHWPNYVGEKRTTLCKAYWIKVWCYWEHFGDYKTIPHKTTQLKKASLHDEYGWNFAYILPSHISCTYAKNKKTCEVIILFITISELWAFLMTYNLFYHFATFASHTQC